MITDFKQRFQGTYQMSLISQKSGGSLHRATGLPAAWLAAALLLAGCGYSMETRSLPDHAHSLSIGKVRNLTYTGELDVRVKQELRQKLLRNPALVLKSPKESDLVLDIDLDSLNVSRALDVSDTDLSSLLYSLSGGMTLYRPFPRKTVVLQRKVSASTRLNFNQAVIETPAVRDEITTDVILAFVAEIEHQLFQHF